MADQNADLRGFIPPHPTPEQACAVGNAIRSGEYYPALIGVFCDECEHTEEADYLVHVEDDQAARFRIARDHLNTVGWACDTRGDYCPNHTHTPCCSAHGKPMSCEQYRRAHFVEIRPCCWVDARQIATHEATRG